MIAYQATLQTAVPAETRGRAFALYDVVWNAARLVSLGTSGILAEVVGIRAVYVLGDALLLAASLVGLTTPIPSSRDTRRRAIPPDADHPGRSTSRWPDTVRPLTRSRSSAR